MLKFSPAIVCLGLFTACTPIPERTQTPPTPRPVPPMPVGTITRQTPQSSLITPKPTKSAKPGTTQGKSTAALSASEVKVRLQQAEDKAVSAASLQQSAQTKEDWNLVISQWQQAIKILTQIPATSPQKATVQQRLAEYQRNLVQAQRLFGSPQTFTQPQAAPQKGGIPLIMAPEDSPAPSPSTSPTPSPDGKISPVPSASPTPAK